MSETSIQQFTGSLGVNEMTADQKFQLVQQYMTRELELAKVSTQSQERMQQQQINACLLPWKQRRLEARLIGLVLFLIGCVLAYDTYKTTDIITKLLNPFVQSLQRPLLPGWEYYLFSESSWVSGYAASIANGVIRFVLFVGCAGKRIVILPFHLLVGLTATSSSAAAGFVLLAFIVFAALLMKFYHSDLYVGLTSVSVRQSGGVELKKLQ